MEFATEMIVKASFAGANRRFPSPPTACSSRTFAPSARVADGSIPADVQPSPLFDPQR
jgi:hypothetical protein